MVVEDFEFKEEAEYGEEQKYSIKEIILRHIRKISDICCKEFTGGYVEKKPIRMQTGVMFTEVYHDDVREAYCNAVDFLIDIIYPMGDKKLKEYLGENEDFKEDDKEVKKYEKDIKDKLRLKRNTFRQINLMFERMNFWEKSESSDE
jgi:hypothetical protein